MQSQPGQGSTFWLTARLGKAQHPTEASHSALTNKAEQILKDEHKGKHVLLVDDEPVNLEVTLLLLQSVGLLVDIAENGKQAFDLAAEHDYAAILMDIQMPMLDGLAATRAIRKLAGKERVPIIAMTANAFNEDRDQCLAVGMNAFLSKPVSPDLLFQTLIKWLA